MKQAKYIVKLTEEQRSELKGILSRGKHTAEKVKRANVLLGLDSMSRYQDCPKRRYMPTYRGIAGYSDVSEATVSKIAKRFVEEGYDAALTRKKRDTPPVEPIIDGETEARIVALACSEPPEGYTRWTLRLLENKVVELGIIERVSDTTIGRTLKKHNLNRI
jgi:transposase